MTDVFSDPKPEGSTEQPTTTEHAQDLLAELVGEGKKFKTVEDLAKGKLEADRFIENLTQEQRELRDSYKALEEKLAKTETVREVLGSQNSASGEGNQPQSVPTEELLKLVDERLNERTEAQTAAANRERANAALLKHFSNDEAKAREFVAAEAKRIGVGTDFLGDMSSKSPEAFLRLVGINQPKANTGTSFDNAVNPDASESSGSVRDAKYYTALRNKLGHRFFEPDIQQQRMRDVKALGDRFFS